MNVPSYNQANNPSRLALKSPRLLSSTYSSSMLFRPKNAPSLSLLIPFRCIFKDLKESSPWNVRPSTILILFLLSSKNWRWGSLKILGGIMLIRFRFNFTTNKELDKLSKQPASRVLILLLLKFRYLSCIRGNEDVLISDITFELRSKLSRAG